MAKKDFLIFFSDQHSGQKCGYRHDKFAKTPNIDKLAQMGTTFDSAYTSCPLCVPARMSFLTSKYANKIDTLDLLATLSANFSTFAYSLGSIGYDTTLIGRMHFTGYDQRHGFLNRLTGDITPIIQGRPKEDSVMREERREYLTTLGAGYTDIVGGGGDTPVTEFDKQVVSDAIDFLQKDYDNPQLICVGPYAPHCTYVDPDEKRYRYYEEKFKDVTINPYDYEMPYFEGRRKYASLDMMRSVRSAYYGLIEFTDDNIGKVYNAFDAYLKRNNREGVFVYVSDHGDEVGEREMYGKMTLFEASANIPMIFVGAGVVKGRSVTAPTSIMDIGVTLCDMADAPIPSDVDGLSLKDVLAGGEADSERMVISEIMNDPMYFKDKTLNTPKFTLGRMVRYRNWKYIMFYGFEQYSLLFDLDKDSNETTNVIKDHADVASMLDLKAREGIDLERIKDTFRHNKEHNKIIREFGAVHHLDSEERWKCPGDKMKLPTIMKEYNR